MLAAGPDTMACAGTPDEVRDRYAARFAGVYDAALLYSPSFGLTPGRFANVSAIIDTFAV